MLLSLRQLGRGPSAIQGELLVTRRIFIDTEWTRPPWAKESKLLWIGLADEEGRSWYGISSEVDITPSSNNFISGLVQLISPDEQRMTNKEIAAEVMKFCGNVDEFWAWIPTVERFAEWFNLGEEAEGLYDHHWDVDLQMAQSLVQPWPEGWPDRLLDLNAAAGEAGVEIPHRSENHLHPHAHAQWNRELYKRIQKSRERCTSLHGSL